MQVKLFITGYVTSCAFYRLDQYWALCSCPINLLVMDAFSHIADKFRSSSEFWSDPYLTFCHAKLPAAARGTEAPKSSVVPRSAVSAFHADTPPSGKGVDSDENLSPALTLQAMHV